jgi:hypothetical protein
MVFKRNALASGLGMAWISIAFIPTWRKVKVGKKDDQMRMILCNYGRKG